MAYEVECTECGELLLIEEPGVEVNCPHCEATLILSEDDLNSLIAAGSGSQIVRSAAIVGVGSDSGSGSSIITGGPLPDEDGEEQAKDDAAPEFAFGEPRDDPSGEGFIKIDTSAEATRSTGDTTPAATKTPGRAIQAGDGSYARRSAVSDATFKSLVSYSVLVTLVLFFLLWKMSQARPHELESLPDIKPAEEGEFRHIREDARLPAGHSLEIGESQRFGNIRITPIKVTRGPLRFRHFQAGSGRSIPPSSPVLKLWLRIENVSDNDVFPPLDLDLVFGREIDPQNYERVYANNWLARSEDLDTRDHRVLLYNHPPSSEFDIAGMPLKPLAPGESLETFLPSQERGISGLDGEVVWRFQVRKGFNPQTMNGVTTLVDVYFDAADVRSDG